MQWNFFKNLLWLQTHVTQAQYFVSIVTQSTHTVFPLCCQECIVRLPHFEFDYCTDAVEKNDQFERKNTIRFQSYKYF